MSRGDGLPKGWMASRLEDVVEIHDDLREPVNAEERANRSGPYPYYGATGQVGWIDGYLLDGQYVLLGEDGAPFLDPSKAKAYMIEGRCWVNNHAHVLRGIPKLCENRYLLHALNHADYRGFANGTTRLKLTQGAMRRLPLRIAPFLEQRRIVAKIEELFSDLDAGVAALQRAKAKLKRYRAAVLKAAVEGRLTEQWRAEHPPKETAAELLKRILKQRRCKWEQDQLAAYEKAGKKPPANWQQKYKEPTEPDDTNLPTLPEGWCWASLGQLVARSEYGTSVKCAYEAAGTPVLRIPNIAGGAISLLDMKYATQQLDLTEDDALQCGDLLMCRTNGSITLIGKAALVTNGLEEAHSFASYLLRFRFVLTKNLPGWVHLYAGSCGGRGFIESHAASSAGQHNISLSLMHGMPIPIAPLAEQEQILSCVEERVSAAQRIADQADANLKRSSRLRQTILKRAFEGKLVPQDPKNEPASALLQSIREPLSRTSESPCTKSKAHTSRER